MRILLALGVEKGVNKKGSPRKGGGVNGSYFLCDLGRA